MLRNAKKPKEPKECYRMLKNLKGAALGRNYFLLSRWEALSRKNGGFMNKKGGFITKNKIQLYMKRSYASSRA